ncbi:unnamed protein product [Adineta steineri]|uniref:Uncharacterized protein n=1 Tax=Adineta steineri TaxID=433720 RepID=A0A819MU73_9BILA|nr:unnamed protein product [Adineta steineri]CAF3986709.1 unnamed protein product [Adineta steineri]
MSKPAARYGYLTSPSDSWHFPSGFRPEMVSFLRDFAGSSWNPASGNIVQGNLDDDINIEELAKPVSVTPEDGEFFNDWLSCYVTAASAETTTPAYNITILNHDLKLEFLQPKLNMFCTSNHIRLISIRSHHVVLRCKLKKKLSKLTPKEGVSVGAK